jgi:hypothetical protein
MYLQAFNVEAHHIRLLKKLHWTMFEQSGETEPTPMVDPKKPYGNSWYIKDIQKAICHSNKKALDIHKEMIVVLEILCKNANISEGVYIKKDSKWIRSEDFSSNA